MNEARKHGYCKLRAVRLPPDRIIWVADNFCTRHPLLSVVQRWLQRWQSRVQYALTGDCGFFCEDTPPYGFVPEAGCPIHDRDTEKWKMSQREKYLLVLTVGVYLGAVLTVLTLHIGGAWR